MFNYAPFSGEYVTFTAHGTIPQSLRDSSLYTREPRKATLTRSFFFHIERTPNRRICSKQPVIARSGATRQSVLLYNAQKRTAVIKRNGFPRTSDVGHWSRDCGIPRFIDLPPSPFRGNDRVFFTRHFLFPTGNFCTPATPQSASLTAPLAGVPSPLFYLLAIVRDWRPLSQLR